MKSTLSPHELIQMATLLHAHATPVLVPYRKDSPALMKHVLDLLEELPRMLEEAFLECDTISELERETERARDLILAHRFRSSGAYHA